VDTLYPDRLPLSPVRIFSVPLNVLVYVRFLDAIRGLPTHFYSGRSVPCQGQECLPAAHKGRQVWKFYGPGEVWEPGPKLWRPWVLEITENLEEQLRGLQLRGQVWALERSGKTPKKSVVTGMYCETLDERSVPRPFDVESVLMRFFRVATLNLGLPSPIPPRLLLSPREGKEPQLPGCVPDLAPRPPTEEEKIKFAESRENFRKMMQRNAGNLNGTPS
jgi:hypothetical protein